MSKCLSKIPCKSCGSSDGLQPFLNEDGTLTGFCFSCQTFSDNPYGNKKPDVKDLKVKSREEIQEEIQEYKSCEHFPDELRSIPAPDLKFYGVRLARSQYDGKTPYAAVLPHTKEGELTGYMIRLLNRKVMWTVGDFKDCDLFGWERAKRVGGRTLYITSGQYDSIALRYILKQGNNAKYKDQDYAVCSLPNGDKSITCLKRQAADIKRRFERVVLVFDDDRSGKEAVNEAMRYIPYATSVTLPAKDANECLKLGLVKQAREAVLFRAAPVVSGIVTFDLVQDKLYEVAEMGQATPWETVNEWIRGQHTRRLYTICGSEGGGKSTLIHSLASYNLGKHGEGNFFVQLEETPSESFLNVGSRLIGRDLTDPLQPITESERDYLQSLFKDKMFVFDPTEDRSNTPQQLVENILSRAREYLGNYKYLYLDNLTKMSEGLDAASRNDFISDFAAEVERFAMRNDVSVWVLSHLNKQQKGETPYSEGGRVNLNALAGGTGLQRYSSGLFSYERNSQAINTDIGKFRILKNRVGRKTGVIKMAYSEFSTRIEENIWDDDEFKTKK